MLKAIYAKEPNRQKMTQRLPKAGLLTVKENGLKVLVKYGFKTIILLGDSGGNQ